MPSSIGIGHPLSTCRVFCSVSRINIRFLPRQNSSSIRGDAGQILGNTPLVNPQKGVSVKQSKAKHAFQHAKSVPRFREKLEPIYFEYLEKLDELSGKGVGNSLLPIGKNISTLR